MINPKNIAVLLVNSFQNFEVSPVNDLEREISVEIEILIGNIIRKSEEGIPWCETSIQLDVNDEEDASDLEVQLDEQNEARDEKKESKEKISLDYKRKAVEFWLNNGNKKKKIESVLHTFKFATRFDYIFYQFVCFFLIIMGLIFDKLLMPHISILSRQLLYHWKTQVESGTYPKWEALEIIDNNSIKRFHELRSQGVVLHDADLQQILLEEAKKINYLNFKVRSWPQASQRG